MLREMTLGRKVALALGTCAVIVATVAAIALAQTRAGSAHLSNVIEVDLPALQALMTIRQGVASVNRGINGMLIPEVAANEQERGAGLTMAADAISALDAAQREWEGLPHLSAISSRWAAVQPDLEAWKSAARATLDGIRDWHQAMGMGRPDDVVAARARALDRFWVSRQAYIRLAKPLAELIESDAGVVRAVKHDALASATRASGVILSVGVLALALMGAFIIVVERDVRRAMAALVAETTSLTRAVREGRLAHRASPAAVGPELRPILEGMNETMEAYARPLALATSCARAIADGEALRPIAEDMPGEFQVLKDALDALIDVVTRRARDLDDLIEAAMEGRLDHRADPSAYRGSHARLIEGLNGVLEAVVRPLRMAASCVERIARGDVPERITEEYRGEFEVLRRNLNGCIEAIQALVADATSLSAAAVGGKLDVRADPARHSGDFRRVIEGVNGALQAIIGPFRITIDYCERISHGEIPPRRTTKVQGDLVALQASLNRCLDALSALVTDADGMAGAALEGKLSARIDTSRHQGAFRAALEGMNRTLDTTLAPIQESAQVLERLAARDLTARVAGQYQGDHARMKESVNAMATALHDALAQVAQAVGQVSSASTQIAASSQAVASGASEQASSVEETTTSLDSISRTTQRTADAAQQARRLVETARAAAGDGSGAVEQMQGAMSRIQASAEGTSQIIRDINDIAFQTNLLALNAAVEAARAGEAGRGFAVVAEEVRSLAARAKEAAAKTEGLIKESVQEAEQGEATSRLVAGKLAEIATGIATVTGIVGEIADSAREQATAIQHVAGAVGEMDKVTQQNAASAEESSSAASELSGQAEELAAMVAAFQLAQQRTEARAPAAAPPAQASVARLRGRVNGTHRTAAERTFPMDDAAALEEF